jgi:hypothetical protein
VNLLAPEQKLYAEQHGGLNVSQIPSCHIRAWVERRIDITLRANIPA